MKKEDKYLKLTLSQNDWTRRLDRVIRFLMPDVPLSLLYKWIRKGDIRVSGRRVDPDYRLLEGDSLWIFSQYQAYLVEKADKKASDPSFLRWIIYEDDSWLVLNKPRGLLVHGEKFSLDRQVTAYLASNLEPSLSFRPAPLHRLDRQTSGLVVIAKTLHAARVFSKTLSEGRLRKFYLALLEGSFQRSLVVEQALYHDLHQRKSIFDHPQGQRASTRFISLVYSKEKSLVLAQLFTGRFHQIRAHAAFLGHPLLGDHKYGAYQNSMKTYLLHACALELPALEHQRQGLFLWADLPQYFERTLFDVFPTFKQKMIKEEVYALGH